MELRHIRYFVAVAEELNFTRAAARLGIGQPPLSQQIKDLEAELGVVLLRRVPHGAELTEAGRAFFQEGLLALAAAERTAVAAKRAGRGEVGRLRLGFTGSAHFNAMVPAAIRAFRQAYPDVDLQLEEVNTSNLLDGLTAGMLDVAFTRARLEGRPQISLHPVQDEELVVVLPLAHGCSNRPAVPLAALRDDPFVMKARNLGPVLHGAVFEACRQAGFEPIPGQQAPQLAAVISLVAAELGVSLVPSSMQHIKASEVVYRPIDGRQAAVTLSLAWRRDERSNVVQNFVALVRSQVAIGKSQACLRLAG